MTARPREELLYVIDDIDAHLSPQWQSRLIGDLRRAFPRVQLVATTHSPYVVASVEPSNVFRVESDGNGVGRIARVADRIKKGDPVPNVMDLAFGSPDLPGPQWALVPARSVRRDVLGVVEEQLPRGAVVSVLPQSIHVKDVKNAFGEQALPSDSAQHGHVFFVDHAPGTAMGHACEYVFRTREGQLVRREGIWPPPDL